MKILWFLWGLPQNIIGLILFLIYRKKRNVAIHKGRYICQTGIKGVGAVSLGFFILFFEEYKDSYLRVLKHEYGHTIQSKILGPFYLIIIGLPSLIWAGLFNKYRQKHKVSYYSFYPERWADKLGFKYF